MATPKKTPAKVKYIAVLQHGSEEMIGPSYLEEIYEEIRDAGYYVSDFVVFPASVALKMETEVKLIPATFYYEKHNHYICSAGHPN